MHLKLQLEALSALAGVRVVLAGLAGSRGRKVAHAASDYDVRFVYMHEPAWYYGPSRKTAPDALAKEDWTRLGFMAAPDEDFVGWELTKYLALMASSNVGALEMAGFAEQNPLVTGDLGCALVALRHLPHRWDAVAFHYAAQAFNTLRGARLANSQTAAWVEGAARPKVYLTALVCALSARWAQTYETVPPVVAADLMNSGLLGRFSTPCVTKALQLLDACMNGDQTPVEARDMQPVLEYVLSQVSETPHPTSTAPYALQAAARHVATLAAKENALWDA